MIPKIIHYSWISGDPYPEKIQRCIDSWKEKLPDYQFINWNRDTFDFDSSQWLKDAYEEQNYAYCSDYLRIYAVYNYGGIWLDTDVEVLKSFNELLELPYFFGAEIFLNYKNLTEMDIEAAVFGSEKGNVFLSTVLNWYETHSYKDIKYNMLNNTLPKIMNYCFNYLYHEDKINYILSSNFKLDFIYDLTYFNMFDYTYFSPLWQNFAKTEIKIYQNENTFCIHHFNGGWLYLVE